MRKRFGRCVHAPRSGSPRSGPAYRTSDTNTSDTTQGFSASIRPFRTDIWCHTSPILHRGPPQMQCSYLPVIRLCRTASRRYHHSGAPPAQPADGDFQWFPRFFDLAEQHALLSAALRKLDAAEPRASRKRRRDFLASRRQDQREQQPSDMIKLLENAFLPDEWYHFEEVRSWRLRSSAGSHLTADGRAITTASFDASGKCVYPHGMTRRRTLS